MDRQKVEMGGNGFTLVELIVTVAVMIILASLATVQFRKMTINASIEKELKMIYADLMELRTKALYENTPRAVRFTRNVMAIYPGSDTSAPPVMTRSLPHGVAWSGSGASLEIEYDTYGISNKLVTVCVEPDNQNSSSVDSLIISHARIRMGKREAPDCKAEYVSLK